MEEEEIITAAPIILFRNVEIARDSLIVLKHVDLEIGEGEFVYLLGKVGSGKSSLIKTFYAEIGLTGDEARIFDYDLLQIKKKAIPHLRRKMGVVFQDFQLLADRDVHSNLQFVLKATGWRNKAEMEQRIEEVLSTVGMVNKSYKMPHELSGGEQQRIAIARALLNQPKLILADEPTGNLDPDTARNVMETLREISSNGTAVIMATHNHALLNDYPGRVVRIENKLVIEDTNG